MDTIITGEINSGKTTTMKRIYNESQRGDGFICQKSYCDSIFTGYDLIRLSDGFTLAFIRLKGEYNSHMQTIFSTGKYIFLKESFNRVLELIEDMMDSGIDPIYIDELGPLELKKECFYQTILDIKSRGFSLVTCVRHNSLEAIIKLFNFQEPLILDVNEEVNDV